MRSKILFKKLLSITRIAIFLIFFFFNFVGLASASSEVRVGVGMPIRLKIAKIKVNAAIENVGFTSNLTMSTPKAPRNVAWFKLGARPGEIGSAVIAGHVNWYNGAYSAFVNLNKLKLGDKISIQNDRGENISFVVTKIQGYGEKDDASDVFISNDGKSHLNMITCEGVWNKKTKSYSKRLVVFTDKE